MLSASGQTAPKAERLLQEKSPYLQRHADNLVDWYAWGDAAFARAKALNRPVFMTLGYSTSPPCTTIERESFMNEEIADYLNENFVCVLVDREERPALDNACIHYLLLVKDSPSWPMHMFLTPERRPLFGSSYLPNDPKARSDGKTLETVLRHVWSQWRRNTENYLQEQSVRDLAKMQAAIDKRPVKSANAPTPLLSREKLEPMVRRLLINSDTTNGGSLTVPKFPLVPNLQWLHQYSTQFPDQSTATEAGRLVETTLEKLASGGIRDHLGGGFHRYAMDERWRVPSFEKTLYDQALLGETYSQLFAQTGKTFYKDIALETLTYMTTRLADADGEFYSSEDSVSLANIDADQPEPGAFYCWTQAEFDTALSTDTQAHQLLKHRFNIRSSGNTPPGADPLGVLKNKNVLYHAHSLEASAKAAGVPASKAETTYRRGLELLKRHRASSPQPMIDRKILVSWNAYAIAALARSSIHLTQPALVESAEKAMAFLSNYMIDNQLAIRRSWLRGTSSIEGICDDYAALVDACLALHSATDDAKWLTQAQALQQKQIDHFLNSATGAFFEIPHHRADLFLRIQPEMDADLLSTNALSARNLVRLSKRADAQHAAVWKSTAARLFQYFETTMVGKSSMTPGLLAAWEEFTRP